jgi:hypothetical protein
VATPSSTPHLIIGDIKTGSVRKTSELHISGGIRAVIVDEKLWSWRPILIGGTVKALSPQPLNVIEDIAATIGGSVIGHDHITGLDTPLVSRVWTPLNGPSAGQMQPADLWRCIAHNARAAGDERYATLSSHIAFSIRAAGIRIRDASDHYQNQLTAAIASGRKPGPRFKNIPMSDLHLAFHSVLSELASTRGYLIAALEDRLDITKKTNGLNLLKAWKSDANRANLASTPIVEDILAASDQHSADPWLYHLSEYRNEFLHRKPLGGSETAPWLRYDQRNYRELVVPFIEMPLAEDASSQSGRDALLRFNELYRKMLALLEKAALAAPFPTTPLHFVRA